MQYDQEYFGSEEFRELLDSYETAVADGNYPFIDADDLVDIADYYNMSGDYDRAMAVVDYALQLYPNATLPNVFMAREAEKQGLDVAVSFGADGVMGEAAVANIAIVDALGRFVCPTFTNILPGTTLLAAMKLAEQKMNVLQQDILHEDIAQAQEVLLLTSSMLCVPVTSFDRVPVGQGELRGKPGPTARWLKDQLFEELFARGTVFATGCV